jgi:hypothetical protein
MSYSAEISRDHPTVLILVIDQSASMEEEMIGGMSKARFVADVLNKTIATLIGVCIKEVNQPPRHYFDVGVVAYNGRGVRPGFGGNLAGKYLHPIGFIADNLLRVEEREQRVLDGAGDLVAVKSKFRVWFDPVSDGARR